MLAVGSLGGIGRLGLVARTARRLWTPSQLTTALWLDAADASTITQSAGAVSAWVDKSGTANHVAQATAANQPLTNARVINGLNALDFDGTNDHLVNSTGFASIMSGEDKSISIFSVITVDNFVSNGWPFSFGSSVSNAPIFGTRSANGSIGWLKSDDAAVATNVISGGHSNSDHIVSSITDTGTTGAIYVNGGGGVAGATNLGVATFDKFTLGSYNRIAPSLYFNGAIGEVLIFSTSLPDADRQKAEGYLAHKWGLTANLPANHPFKNLPPLA